MAATIKPIEAKSVHQIQSGQVIVDLSSVIKELVENALDAAASSIEVRFRNSGLDAIEVQDNGSGIAETNYDSVGLKHYTSKLYSYAELSKLNTFGFRGEALSSLCALSTLSIVTAQGHEAPKGKRLEFETSGKLKSATLTAAQKGTTVCVEDLFSKLPVRRKELTKNIKREYGKVMGLLHAYACISTGVKFTVKNTMSNGKSTVAFSTKANVTTRENIANVYGAKMLSQLIELDLNLDFVPALAQNSRAIADDTKVRVEGHISKPIFGEGRQTPDRQMVFVNGRPCGLPQILKAINEVYKSFNVSQSPFIFANFQMNTEAYDVNVSPDKRTIFLHNATALTESLQASLTDLFDKTEQSLPHSRMNAFGQQLFRKHGTSEQATVAEPGLSKIERSSRDRRAKSTASSDQDKTDGEDSEDDGPPITTLPQRSSVQNITYEEGDSPQPAAGAGTEQTKSQERHKGAKILPAGPILGQLSHNSDDFEETDTQPLQQAASNDERGEEEEEEEEEDTVVKYHVPDFNARVKERSNKRGSMSTAMSSGEGEKRSMQRLVGIHKNRASMTIDANGRAQTQKIPLAVVAQEGRLPVESDTTDGNTQALLGDPDESASLPNERATAIARAQPWTSKTLSPSRALPSYGPSGESDHQKEALKDEFPHNEKLLHEIPEASEGRPDADDGQDDQVASASVSHPVETTELDRIDDGGNDEATVRELIQLAETSAPDTSGQGHRRLNQALKASSGNDATVSVVLSLNTTYDQITEQYYASERCISLSSKTRRGLMENRGSMDMSEEERLSLAISKKDFASMRIAGQFNLGFIVAVRVKDGSGQDRQRDEVFIVDQHASDEIYNFERLQRETVVSNQRLVHPIRLDLTAVEEEILMENSKALEKNGFILDNDVSGEQPIGQRCRLVSLPLSKEVVFGERDLEELIHLLSEAHVSSESTYIPRPSKVRKMFAMRACRSSIMIGKTLSNRQMSKVLQHMGTIDKPWNCPHGRPTMRHLTSLDELDAQLWREGDGVFSGGSEEEMRATADVWKHYAASE